MSNAQNAGIDYGRGTANVDVKTGIRYGVISQNSVNLGCWDEAEADYGEPHCPKCGNEAVSIPSHTESSNPPGQWVSIINDVPEAYAKFTDSEGECSEYACESCRLLFGSESAFPEDAIGYSYERDGYKLTDCLDSDIFVLSSPFYTFAQFCSPCVPGAGNLDSPIPERAGGTKTYALGAEWFDDDIAPYPLWRVDTSELVKPTKVRLACNSCQMVAINSMPVHESGCPNDGARWEVGEDGEGEWVRYQECFICGCDVKVGERCGCDDLIEDDTSAQLEHCTRCGVELEESQIGLCDTCQGTEMS